MVVFKGTVWASPRISTSVRGLFCCNLIKDLLWNVVTDIGCGCRRRRPSSCTKDIWTENSLQRHRNLRALSRANVTSVCQPSVLVKSSNNVLSSVKVGDVTIRSSCRTSSYKCVKKKRQRQNQCPQATFDISWVESRNVIRCQSLSHFASSMRLDRSRFS